MRYSVNVDFETANRPGESTECREHPNTGPHFDITVHLARCSPHGRTSRPQRYWKDFETVEEAEQFANDCAAEPEGALPHPVMVRFCQRCRP